MYYFLLCQPIFAIATFWAHKPIWPSHLENVVPTIILAFELRDKLLKIFWIFLKLVHESKINIYLTKGDKQFKLNVPSAPSVVFVDEAHISVVLL